MLLLQFRNIGGAKRYSFPYFKKYWGCYSTPSTPSSTGPVKSYYFSLRTRIQLLKSPLLLYLLNMKILHIQFHIKASTHILILIMNHQFLRHLKSTRKLQNLQLYEPMQIKIVKIDPKGPSINNVVSISHFLGTLQTPIASRCPWAYNPSWATSPLA